MHQILVHIEGAVESIDSAGPLGTTVYNKFFNGVDPDRVKAVLSNITAGHDISIHSGPHQPVIACANPDMPHWAASWAACQQSKPKANAMWVANSPFIFLCPVFFTYPEVPTSVNCVGGRATRTTFSTGQGLGANQFGILFHELVHLYLDSPPLEPEMMGLWESLDLPASESVINPTNYVFYLASMFLLSLIQC